MGPCVQFQIDYKELLGQTFSKQITSKLDKNMQWKQKVTKLVYDNMNKDTDALPTKPET